MDSMKLKGSGFVLSLIGSEAITLAKTLVDADMSPSSFPIIVCDTTTFQLEKLSNFHYLNNHFVIASYFYSYSIETRTFGDQFYDRSSESLDNIFYLS